MKDLCIKCRRLFGSFPKGGRKAWSCFEPGAVYTDVHFGRALPGWQKYSRLERTTLSLKTH